MNVYINLIFARVLISFGYTKKEIDKKVGLHLYNKAINLTTPVELTNDDINRIYSYIICGFTDKEIAKISGYTVNKILLLRREKDYRWTYFRWNSQKDDNLHFLLLQGKNIYQIAETLGVSDITPLLLRLRGYFKDEEDLTDNI